MPLLSRVETALTSPAIRPFTLALARQCSGSPVGVATTQYRSRARVNSPIFARSRRALTVVSLYELATALGVSHMELLRLPDG